MILGLCLPRVETPGFADDLPSGDRLCFRICVQGLYVYTRLVCDFGFAFRDSMFTRAWFVFSDLRSGTLCLHALGFVILASC